MWKPYPTPLPPPSLSQFLPARYTGRARRHTPVGEGGGEREVQGKAPPTLTHTHTHTFVSQRVHRLSEKHNHMLSLDIDQQQQLERSLRFDLMNNAQGRARDDEDGSHHHSIRNSSSTSSSSYYNCSRSSTSATSSHDGRVPTLCSFHTQANTGDARCSNVIKVGEPRVRGIHDAAAALNHQGHQTIATGEGVSHGDSSATSIDGEAVRHDEYEPFMESLHEDTKSRQRMSSQKEHCAMATADGPMQAVPQPAAPHIAPIEPPHHRGPAPSFLGGLGQSTQVALHRLLRTPATTARESTIQQLLEEATAMNQILVEELVATRAELSRRHHHNGQLPQPAPELTTGAAPSQYPPRMKTAAMAAVPLGSVPAPKPLQQSRSARQRARQVPQRTSTVPRSQSHPPRLGQSSSNSQKCRSAHAAVALGSGIVPPRRSRSSQAVAPTRRSPVVGRARRAPNESWADNRVLEEVRTAGRCARGADSATDLPQHIRLCPSPGINPTRKAREAPLRQRPHQQQQRTPTLQRRAASPSPLQQRSHRPPRGVRRSDPYRANAVTIDLTSPTTYLRAPRLTAPSMAARSSSRHPKTQQPVVVCGRVAAGRSTAMAVNTNVGNTCGHLVSPGRGVPQYSSGRSAVRAVSSQVQHRTAAPGTPRAQKVSPRPHCRGDGGRDPPRVSPIAARDDRLDDTYLSSDSAMLKEMEDNFWAQLRKVHEQLERMLQE